MDSVGIGKRIADLMAAAGINQVQLAQRSGLHQGYIANVLKRNQRSMSTDIASKFAAALGVSTAYILTGKDGGDVPAAVESPPPPPTSDVHVSRAAAREMVKAAFNKEEHEYEDAIAAEDALLVGAPFVQDLDPTEYVRRLLDTAARRRERGQTVEGKDLHSATMKAAFEESRELRAQLARQREFEERARIFLRENGIDPDTLEPAKNTTHAPRLVPTRPTTPRPKSGSNNK